MKNIKNWKPSKYIIRKGRLLPSDNTKELSTASRLMASLIATKYQEAIPKYCRGVLLDLGCGKAPFYELYRDYIADVVLVDWPNSVHDTKFIDLAVDLNKSLPLDDEKFDSVILSDVLEHIYCPDKLLSEIYRVMTKNSHILINVPFLYWLHEEPYDYYRFTRYYLIKIAESSGFLVEVMQPLGGSLEIFADFLSKNIAITKIPVIAEILVRLIQSSSILLSSTTLAKKAAYKTSKNFPLGYFLVLKKI